MKKETQNIALFDMDGVLCDYDKALIKDYNKIKSKSDPEFKNYSKKIIPFIQNRKDIIRRQPGWWENLEKKRLGFEILKIAREVGLSIYILTHAQEKFPNSWAEKVRWVKKHVKNAQIIMAEEKWVVYGKVLIDDHPLNAKKWLNARRHGLVIMPIQKYNKNFKHERCIKTNGKNLNKIRKALNLAKNRQPGAPLDLSKL